MSRPAHYRVSPREALTQRQREVLALMAKGYTNGQIADALGITLDGAKFHVSEILSRLDVGSREEAVAAWRRRAGPLARLRGLAGLLTTKFAVGSTAAVVLMAAASAAVVSVALNQSTDESGAHNQETSPSPVANASPPPTAVAVTPALALLDGAGDIATAVERMRTESPAASEVIDAVLRGDFGAYLAHVVSVTKNCDELVTRGGSRCEALGVPAGTTVTLFHEDSEWVGAYLEPRQAVEDNFRYLTEGRAPRLGVVARRSDGAFTAIIMIEPKPGMIFPGRTLDGGADVRAILVTVSADGIVLRFGSTLFGGPPLEWLHESARSGKPYEVLGASDEYTGLVQQQQAVMDALNNASNGSAAGVP